MVALIFSLAAPLLSAPFFFTNPLIVNSLYTELQAGTLMIWCSYLLIRAAQQPRAWRLLLTGVFTLAVVGLILAPSAASFHSATACEPPGGRAVTRPRSRPCSSCT